jgi:glycosyltransferase involved in cell wall biosynthesis
MTKLGLRPWTAADHPPPRSAPVTVVILSKNEEANIGRCLASVAWAAQVVVFDSGSTDGTIAIARSHEAEVIHQPWLGFAAQREAAIRQPSLRHDWVYFVDADEWVSAALAVEISGVVRAPTCAAYAQRLRLVFQGRWIRHCGWYRGSWVVRLVDRRHTKYGGDLVGERAQVDGPMGRLGHDIVDEDLKGLASWLHKHVDYARLEARQRGGPQGLMSRIRRLRERTDSRPWIRAALKDVVFPSVPAKPLAIFLYMYVIRLGLLDGLPGLRFCFYHAWYEACVSALRPVPDNESRPVAPKLGILDFHPIQYHAPLYRTLAERARVDLDILFLRDRGHRAFIDPGFGVQVAWNIDLLSGYRSNFLTSTAGTWRRLRDLLTWLRRHEVVVIHGHSDPWMLGAALACRSFGIPFLLRGDAGPDGASQGPRRLLRHLIARTAVSQSAGGLAVGKLNEAFYRKYGSHSITFAPHSVDNESFGRKPPENRSCLLRRLGLPEADPVIMFCGKLQPHKRPLDIITAARLLQQDVTLLFVGDGILAGQIRERVRKGHGAVTGFVNQAELSSYYHAADILVLPSQAEPWGLVVNEAMAVGVLPVVSNLVGAAPDLVAGIGEIYECGDVSSLAAALDRALMRMRDPDVRIRIRERVACYSIDQTAAGFELAALAASAARSGGMQ